MDFNDYILELAGDRARELAHRENKTHSNPKDSGPTAGERIANWWRGREPSYNYDHGIPTPLYKRISRDPAEASSTPWYRRSKGHYTRAKPPGIASASGSASSSGSSPRQRYFYAKRYKVSHSPGALPSNRRLSFAGAGAIRRPEYHSFSRYRGYQSKRVYRPYRSVRRYQSSFRRRYRY